MTTRLVKKEQLLQSHVRYDLEVETNHNFIANDIVVHNCNGRWVYNGDKIHCGSRTEWKREYAIIHVPENKEDIMKKMELRDLKLNIITPEISYEEMYNKLVEKIRYKNEHPLQNMWWTALKMHPEIEQFITKNPDVIVYGEVYGAVQNLRYGVPSGKVRIGVFDLMKNGTWLNYWDARNLGPQLPWLPIIYEGYYDFDKLVALSDGNSHIPGANHYREGIVVSPLIERYNEKIGRVKLKIVSPTYLEKN